MKIAVLGLGYVGITSVACLARLGHDVVGVDVVESKVDMVNEGRSPVQEPGVPEMLAEALETGRLSATVNAEQAVSDSDACLVCVGTPSLPDGSIDTSYLARVMKMISELRVKSGRSIPILMRSTSLPAVHEELMELLRDAVGLGQDLAYCVHPEFLREGQAVADFFDPPKIIFGCSDSVARQACEKLYPEIDAPTVYTSPQTAALVKYADNSFHAVKVTFGNEIGRLSSSFGVDAREVMEIFCLDTKLNLSPYYLRPGMPYGGSCLPKDLRGVVSWARRNAMRLPMLEQVSESNDYQLREIISSIMQTGRQRIGVFGLAFKDNTDDLRESPIVALVEHLVGKGRDVQIYDNCLVPQQLIGSNRSQALTSLPHLERMLTPDPRAMVSGSDLIVIARKGLDIDFDDMPWDAGKIVFDLAGLDNYDKIDGDVHGLYWPGMKPSPE